MRKIRMTSSTSISGMKLISELGLQRLRERIAIRAFDHVLVYRVVSFGVDRDVDLIETIGRLVRFRGRQVDLKLREARVRRRHHEEDQDDEQHVDQRDEVDLRARSSAPARANRDSRL